MCLSHNGGVMLESFLIEETKNISKEQITKIYSLA